MKNFTMFAVDLDQDSRNCNSTCKEARCNTLVVILLVLAGDIEINPGPVKFPCKMCHKPVVVNHRAVMCDRAECQQWVHIKCGGIITPEEYEELKNSSPSKKAVWFCSVCENLNLMTSFSSNDSFPTDNSFSVLSDSELEEESIGSDDDDDNESNLSSQSSASSTTTSPENSNSPRSKPKFRKLKLMLVNVRSVKSKRKQRDLHALFEQADPDIVQLVPIKTLQSLHAKFRVISESFETKLNCTIITRD